MSLCGNPHPLPPSACSALSVGWGKPGSEEGKRFRHRRGSALGQVSAELAPCAGLSRTLWSHQLSPRLTTGGESRQGCLLEEFRPMRYQGAANGGNCLPCPQRPISSSTSQSAEPAPSPTCQGGCGSASQPWLGRWKPTSISGHPKEDTSGHACLGITSTPCVSTVGRGSQSKPCPCLLSPK